MFRTDTISAISTGLTDSGIGIIRISGPDAVSVGDRLFRLPSGKRILKNLESHRLQYGYIVNKNTEDHDPEWKDYIIDEVMAVVMRAPGSFTGEDTIEIQCHGGVLVMKKILELTLQNGARSADPGEFTKRAFLNGKMDLSRAEAVMDLIHSENEYALASSIDQLKGKMAFKVKELRSEIIYEIAFIESALDDPEHISLDGYPERLSEKLDKLIAEIEKLLSTVRDGRLIREGINTVIIGKPNVGKSSILNFLVGQERAIVTEVAGTTRDVLEERITLDGIGLNIIDTAGIRNTEDKVEKIGVEKAKQYAKDADLILYVMDSSVLPDENDREIFSLMTGKKAILLLNKSDLNSPVPEEKFFHFIEDFFGQDSPVVIRTSVKEEFGFEEFKRTIKEMFFCGKLRSSGELVVTNERHAEAFREAFHSLNLVKESISRNMPEDFYSIDLMNAYSSLGRIIGEEVDDDLIEEIFSKFCMGK